MPNGDDAMPLSRRSAGLALMGLGSLWALATPVAAADEPPPTRRRVRVLSTTDRAAAQPLIDSFERRHGGLQVEYRQLGSVELYDRFLVESASPGAGPDVVWSSAMDLQI